MDKEATQTADLYYLAAWAHNNRKRLIRISIAVAAAAVIVGGYFWYTNGRENSAGEALSNVKQPSSAEEAALPQSPEPYLKVAEEYSGTGAAARALLIAGGIQFENGKYADARTTFDKFMNQYSGSPLANEAQLGVAASLEAEGNIKEATARYEDMVKRHQADYTTVAAKVALARLYAAQGKPDQALQQYDDLVKGNNNDSWTFEAKLERDELVAKFPNLVKPVMPIPTAPAAFPPASSSLTNSSATVTIPAKTNK